jgi:hypothetical protein
LDQRLFIPASSDLCQYTKLSTLGHLLKAKFETELPEPKFRLSNIAYLNDPSEGQVFIDLLNKLSNGLDFTNLFVGYERSKVSRTELHLNETYIGSFSTAENKLTMWSQYGDKCAGCCIIFDSSFFVSTDNEDISALSERRQPIDLRRVIYWDTNDDEQEGRINEKIESQLNEIIEVYRIWKEDIADNEALRKIVVSELNKLRFLFKSSDYSYEDEVRLILNRDDYTVPFVDRSSDIPKLYVNVENPVRLKEVILGSKVENPSAIAQFLLSSGVEKVTLSGINFR